MSEFDQHTLRDEEIRGGFEPDNESFGGTVINTPEPIEAETPVTTEPVIEPITTAEQTSGESVYAPPIPQTPTNPQESDFYPKILLGDPELVEQVEHHKIPQNPEQTPTSATSDFQQPVMDSEPILADLPPVTIPPEPIATIIPPPVEHKKTDEPPPYQAPAQSRTYNAGQNAQNAKPKRGSGSLFDKNALALMITSVLCIIGTGIAYLLLTKNREMLVWLEKMTGQKFQLQSGSLQTTIQPSDSLRRADSLTAMLRQTPDTATTINAGGTGANVSVAAAAQPEPTTLSTNTTNGSVVSSSTQEQTAQSPATAEVETGSNANKNLSNNEPEKSSDSDQLANDTEQPQQKRKTSVVKNKNGKIPPKFAQQGLYTIQVFASPSMLEADTWRRRLERRGFRGVYVVSVQSGGQFVHRVRFGSYRTLAEAEAVARSTGYGDSWVARLR